ncbi:MAG: LD-carboxypeptidase [Marinilabiliales bacterium]
MKSLNPLVKGDKVIIISPSGKIDKSKITNAINHLESWGLMVLTGEYSKHKYYQFAGTDRQRLQDLQNALDRLDIKAIFCARGGYGLNRIVDSVDFTRFLKHPKWIVGFSDITILHQVINNKFHIPTIHGLMPNSYPDFPLKNKPLNMLKKTLFGSFPNYKIKSHQLNRKGKGAGKLVGGNLSVLYSLRGTNHDYDFDGKILFIEDLSEYHYHVDRMMINLKNGEKLKNLAGLIVGKFSAMKDKSSRFGKSVEEIIYEAVSEYNYPVCFNFPAGHIKVNLPLIFGKEIELSVDNQNSYIKYF